ncbi:hypothetical protein N7G274_002431 [Stereocaulon virgatum]|uniref:C3H1-type domain-containing protein n=1 Tax=Stereocaulon virgatum TaxID=373712 RepID=A0ABR4AJ25_9LECA
MEDLRELSHELSIVGSIRPIEIQRQPLHDHQAGSLTSLTDESDVLAHSTEQTGPDEHGYYHHFRNSVPASATTVRDTSNYITEIEVPPSTSPSRLTQHNDNNLSDQDSSKRTDDDETSDNRIPAFNIWSASNEDSYHSTARHRDASEFDEDYDVSERVGSTQEQDVLDFDKECSSLRADNFQQNEAVSREERFAQCIEKWHQQDLQRDEYLTHLQQENTNLRNAFSLRLRTEKLPDCWNSNPRAEAAERRFLETHKAANTNPFVFVLIDGEGYNIHECFLKNGKMGGEGLAIHLREEVLSLLQSNMDATNWKIMVNFYIDVGTVFAKCVSADVGITEDCLREFVHGFNQAQPLFDLVDVGRRREQTVLKIQGLFQFYVDNVHCKQIIFGCCHESTYVTVLERYMDNHMAVSRVNLLRSCPHDEDYNALPFRLVEFLSVFQSENLKKINVLVDSSEPPVDDGSNLCSQHLESATSGDDSGQDGTDMQAIYNWQGVANENINVGGLNTLHPPLPRVHTQGSGQQIIWGPSDKAILLNVNDQRVDTFLGKLDDEVHESMLDRMAERDFCIWHHLKGICYNKTCKLRHGGLSKEELVVLVLFNRARKPCDIGSGCRRAGCHRGHLCPRQPGCKRGKLCPFYGVHDVNATAVKVWQSKQYSSFPQSMHNVGSVAGTVQQR